MVPCWSGTPHSNCLQKAMAPTGGHPPRAGWEPHGAPRTSGTQHTPTRALMPPHRPCALDTSTHIATHTPIPTHTHAHVSIHTLTHAHSLLPTHTCPGTHPHVLTRTLPLSYTLTCADRRTEFIPSCVERLWSRTQRGCQRSRPESQGPPKPRVGATSRLPVPAPAVPRGSASTLAPGGTPTAALLSLVP